MEQRWYEGCPGPGRLPKGPLRLAGVAPNKKGWERTGTTSIERPGLIAASTFYWRDVTLQPGVLSNRDPFSRFGITARIHRVFGP